MERMVEMETLKMNKIWMTMGVVLVCAFGVFQGMEGAALSSSGAKGHASGGWAVMFKEAHQKKYFNGKLRFTGYIAQVCQSIDGHHCKHGGKQVHLRYGDWKWFWPNGKLKAKRHYDMGHLQGSSEAWYATGQKRWSEHFKHGKLDGVRKVWFENGKVKSVSHFKHGRLDGAAKTWWWNGSKASAGSYVKGKKEGSWKSWYVSGHNKAVVTYKEGLRHGKAVLFWYVCRPAGCGSVQIQNGFWKNGKKSGRWTYNSIDSNGKLTSKTQTY